MPGPPGPTGATGATGATGLGGVIAVIVPTRSVNFGRADPGFLAAVTATCGPGTRVIGGGVDTQVLNGNANDLPKVQLVSSHSVGTGAWQSTSIVRDRLSQQAELIYTVQAFCIPGP
jgi:hypothetical protein